MDFLFFFVKGRETYQPESDPIRLLQNYFETEGAFTHAFLIALCVALVGLIIFYCIFGMKVFKLANHKVYWCTFAIVGVLTFCLTQFLIIGGKSSVSGFFASAETSEYVEEYFSRLDGDEVTEALQNREDLEDKMDGFCDVVAATDFTNSAVALIIFFGLSFAVKGFTNHAKKIPF